LKYVILTRGLQEVLGGDIIKQVLSEGRTPKGYWGSATTGRPHVGYLVPLTKIADFLRAGAEVTILLADVHAFLDNLKAPLSLVAHRCAYYRHLLTAVFKTLRIPIEKLKIVEGSSYQLSKEYTLDVYKLSTIVTEHDAKKAGAEVVKQVESPLLSGLLYPGLQALDEEYLGVDFQFGGADQRKIFTYAEQYLPKLGYRKRAHLMNSMVPSMQQGGKMSSSDPNSKIDFLDGKKAIEKKIKSAFCEEGKVEDNGVLAFVKAVVVPIAQLRRDWMRENANEGFGITFTNDNSPPGTLLTISRKPEFGGDLHYTEYEAIEKDYISKAIHPGDLKNFVKDSIWALLEPIQKQFDESEEWKVIEAAAYPSEKPTEKVAKKKEKVYHPPPPGKGKTINVKGVVREMQPATSTPEPEPVVTTAPDPDVKPDPVAAQG